MNNKELTELIKKYNDTPKQIVSANIRRLTNDKDIDFITQITGAARQTVYGWRKIPYGNKIPFDTAYLLCNGLGVSIDELMREVELQEDHTPQSLCRVCGKHPANAAKGMCWTCYRKQ